MSEHVRNLSELAIRFLKALTDSPIAWMSPEALAIAVELDAEATYDLLAELDAGGWLSIWERESAPLVTLSALSAERLGVRLVEAAGGRGPRWLAKDLPEPPLPKARRVFADERASGLEFLPSRDDCPATQAELKEERERKRAKIEKLQQDQGDPRNRSKRELPFPSILLGLDLPVWLSNDPRVDDVCPACRSRALRPDTYCLYCDRWGRDPFPGERRAGSAKQPSPKSGPSVDELRERRKAKHHAKILDRVKSAKGRNPKKPEGFLFSRLKGKTAKPRKNIGADDRRK